MLWKMRQPVVSGFEYFDQRKSKGGFQLWMDPIDVFSFGFHGIWISDSNMLELLEGLKFADFGLLCGTRKSLAVMSAELRNYCISEFCFQQWKFWTAENSSNFLILFSVSSSSCWDFSFLSESLLRCSDQKKCLFPFFFRFPFQNSDCLQQNATNVLSALGWDIEWDIFEIFEAVKKAIEQYHAAKSFALLIDKLF